MSVEQEARELLAAAFDEHGPTGYARHIRSGAADWPWVDPALNAITAALLRSSASRDEVLEEAWQPIETAPHACHVIAARFDPSFGEWIYGIVASPPTKPFTHWLALPAPLKSGALYE